MAGAHAHTVSPSSLLRSGNVRHGNQGGSALPQPILSSLAARRSQFGGVNMLAGFSNNPLLDGVSNPGLSGWCPRGMALVPCICWCSFMLQNLSFRSCLQQCYSSLESSINSSIFCFTLFRSLKILRRGLDWDCKVKFQFW